MFLAVSKKHLKISIAVICIAASSTSLAEDSCAKVKQKFDDLRKDLIERSFENLYIIAPYFKRETGEHFSVEYLCQLRKWALRDVSSYRKQQASKENYNVTLRAGALAALARIASYGAPRKSVDAVMNDMGLVIDGSTEELVLEKFQYAYGEGFLQTHGWSKSSSDEITNTN